MSARVKVHPALRHGGYSATNLLPGEDRAAFEKLYRDLIAEYAPDGVFEHDIVATMVRYLWRKQNLETFRIAARAREHYLAIEAQHGLNPALETFYLDSIGPDELAAARRVAEEQARKELGDRYALVEIGEAATLEGLEAALAIEERLREMIDKCIKQLFQVRGLKSLTSVSPPAPPLRISGPSKAA